jgi:hypothetical protein
MKYSYNDYAFILKRELPLMGFYRGCKCNSPPL